MGTNGKSPRPRGIGTRLVVAIFPEYQPHPGALILPAWKIRETLRGSGAQGDMLRGSELGEVPAPGRVVEGGRKGSRRQLPGRPKAGIFAVRQSPKGSQLGVLGHSAWMPRPYLHLQFPAGRRGGQASQQSHTHALFWPPAWLSKGSTCMEVTFTDLARKREPSRPWPVGVMAEQVWRSGQPLQDLGACGAGVLGSPTRDIFPDSCGFEQGHTGQIPI